MKVINKIKNWAKENKEELFIYGASFAMGVGMTLIGYGLGRYHERGEFLEVRDVTSLNVAMFDGDPNSIYLEFKDRTTRRHGGYLPVKPEDMLRLNEDISKALMMVEAK